MLRLRLTLLFSAFLCISSVCFAQRRVSLVGNVYFGDDSHPAGNVTVSLDSPDEGHFADGVTNGAGQFRFGNLKPSIYVLKIDEEDFAPVSKTIDATLGSDKNVTIYLQLKSQPPSTGKGTAISAHELSVPEKARELEISGKRKLYQDRDLAGALSDFERAISIAPGYYEARYNAGMAYWAMARLTEAENSFRRSAEISGDKFGEADVCIGAILLDQGSASEGERMIRKGLRLSPNFWLGHYELGRALLNKNQLPEAEVSASEARLLAPAAPIVYRLLSNIHLAEKDYSALIEDIDSYLALDPTSPVGLRAKELRDQFQRKLALAPGLAKP
ncbi:MAG: tetratricopeptide repeat protein [Candidatus Acidiferrum sp.]